MEETKSWYKSNAVIASILQMAVGLVMGMGWINDAAGSTIVAEGPAVIIGLVNGVLGAWGLFGRIRATKTLV